ncbi:hypothetical protein HYALB_00003163 [Hymenoscyphus albidus]|uniref:HTH CENPB-type domain-containing protein n=2 Tax=Hymenoscyphus albidus TaxID=595503 RepID=A0A9N9LEJ0_9HELO|nr:hypothetical protein HYALB_00003163 [Hymenoscyphus albidus]
MSRKEGQIALAISAYNKGQFTSLKAACTRYDAPYSTTYDRVKGAIPQRDFRPRNQKLTDLEESALIQWMLSMEARGLPVRKDSIRQMADLLLEKRTGRHDSLRTKYTRKYDYKRAKCEDPTIIRDWFRLVHNIVAKYGILAEDIYNFDETGFQMGVIATAKVVTGSEYTGRAIHIQPGNREWVTVVESICADGWVLPPMVIFEGKVHISTWYTDQLPADWTIALSDKGWTNDSLGLKWLSDVFEKYTKDRVKGVYRLLILDGHGSHSTPEFDLFCSEHNIITLCMPPHSSHLLQPLDVSCFAVLKRLYGRGVEELVRAGTYHIDKPDFLSIYRVARTSTMVKNTICNGFATTGLVPYNPDQVLSKLHTQLHTPTPPLLSPNLLPWVPETPHNTYEADQQTQTIKASIKRRTNVLSSPTAIALDQLVKGCKMAMQSATVLAEENRRLRAESERQKKKKTVRRQYIATGGVLTGQEGRELIQNSDNMVLDEAVAPLIEPRIRAPRTCSICRSLAHTAPRCPDRE